MRLKMAEYTAWLAFAQRDLNVARFLRNTENIALNIVVFYTHEAAEKSFKAYLQFRNQRIIKTHDLHKLVKLCISLNRTFIDYEKSASALTPYALATYPDSTPKNLTIEMADNCIKIASEILHFVEEKCEF